MNRGLLTGVKNGLFVPEQYGGGDPANDGQMLSTDSTQPGGVKLTAGATKDYADLARLTMSPGGASIDTFARNGYSNVVATPTTGVLYMVGVALPLGYPVGHLSWISGSQAAVTPTHWWFGLYDSARVQLAVTADQTSAAWAANTVKTLNVATTAAGAATSFITTYAGFHYLGFMMTAATLVTLPAAAIAQSSLNSLPPILCGVSSTALTTPPTFPTTAAVLSVSSTLPYAYVAA